MERPLPQVHSSYNCQLKCKWHRLQQQPLDSQDQRKPPGPVDRLEKGPRRVMELHSVQLVQLELARRTAALGRDPQSALLAAEKVAGTGREFADL